MKPANETLMVELGKLSYPIVIGKSISGRIIETRDEALESGRKGVLLLDESVLLKNPRFCSVIRGEMPQLVLPSGEATKSVDFLEKVWDFMAKEKVDRTGFLFAMGGGVVGDLAGFAAATYLRGIDFYQIPTTLLAMVDSSVGGKTGINLKSGKNLAGSFFQPKAVWADLDLLQTLPEREFAAGMAEVIKYGLLGDSKLFDRLLSLSSNLDCNDSFLSDVISACCQNKAEIVKQDEKETSQGEGGRALLNLGHTFAHAIEAIAGYGTYLHGEAVSIGLVCAWRLSKSFGYLIDFDEQLLVELLHRYHLPTELKKPLKIEDLMDSISSDKKVSQGKLRFILLRAIGSSFVKELSSSKEIKDIWRSVGATD